MRYVNHNARLKQLNDITLQKSIHDWLMNAAKEYRFKSCKTSFTLQRGLAMAPVFPNSNIKFLNNFNGFYLCFINVYDHILIIIIGNYLGYSSIKQDNNTLQFQRM